MGTIACQITGVSIVNSTVGSGLDQRKHESFVSPVNSHHKGPVIFMGVESMCMYFFHQINDFEFFNSQIHFVQDSMYQPSKQTT